LTYKETRNNLQELKQKREKIIEEIEIYEAQVAELFKTQSERININMSKDLISIDLAKNRQVVLPYSILTKVLELFEATDLVISSPIRCKLEITLLYDISNNESEPSNGG
jgi:hypothetical protein